MDRRSFLVSLGSTGLAVGSAPQQTRSKLDKTGDGTAYWDALDRTTKLLRLAERVVPGTDLAQLTITPEDLNGAASNYEQSQSGLAGTPFVTWLTNSGVSVTAGDIAATAYTITDEDKVRALLPHHLDGAAIALPAGETDAVVSAVTDWEDHAREQASHVTSTRSVPDNRGLTRHLTFTNPDGYRIQRLRILGDRLLVHWVEGVYTDDEPRLSGMVPCQVEKEILLRRVRAHLDAGHSIPDEPILLGRSRWRE